MTHPRPPLEDLIYPPFRGFSREGISFLRRLKANNNRAWFAEHRSEYEELVRFPMQCLIASLGARMRDIAPEFEFHPRASIFRIHRDIRFSRDKSPYKTNIAASFGMRGVGGAPEGPGLYVGIEPGNIFMGGGLYMPAPAQLKAIRARLAARPEEYLGVVESRRFRTAFGEILGDRLAKAPLGYAADHPMIRHLRLKQFYAGVELDDHQVCFYPGFRARVQRVLTDVLPLVRWLHGAVTGRES
ncbi:MAG: DUF2461 domain-containing protein [Bacteroidota bacterium]